MLNNTLYRLKVDKKLTIGYFGGSITEGAGASDSSRTSYRARTTNWFRTQYPDCEIVEVNAAIGGTGTELGIFRCERDLLSGKPDLVLMEFSVNDSGGNVREVMTNSETIVRKIYTVNPYADIVYLHTIGAGMSDNLAHGGVFFSRAAHTAVMSYYDILQLDMGEVLRNKVISESAEWSSVLASGPHPNDEGYAVYAEALTGCLNDNLSKAEGEKLIPVMMPVSFTRENRENAHLVNACEAVKDMKDWCVVDQSMCGKYDNYLESAKPGATFSFTFTGRRIGFYLMKASDAGDLCYRIDDGEEKRIRTWDHFCTRFNRAFGILLPDQLDDGQHTLTVRVSDIKDENSLGYVIRIGAFMVY